MYAEQVLYHSVTAPAEYDALDGVFNDIFS